MVKSNNNYTVNQVIFVLITIVIYKYILITKNNFEGFFNIRSKLMANMN